LEVITEFVNQHSVSADNVEKTMKEDHTRGKKLLKQQKLCQEIAMETFVGYDGKYLK